MELKDYNASLIAEYESSCLLGNDYVPIMQDAMKRLAEIWDDERAQALAAFDFVADQKSIISWFRGLLGEHSGPPTEASTLILWFVGSGPNYPLSVTAYVEKIPVGNDDYVDTEIFEEEVWGPDELGFCYSPFATKANEELVQRPTANKEEAVALNRLEVTIIGFYARLLVSWLATQFQDDWLKHRDEIDVVYGITGNDDGHIAGRISCTDGWQPLPELLEN